jgi:hypothetical protein
MEDKKRSARKQKNLDDNTARHEANVAMVARAGIAQATSDHVKLKRDNKGNTHQVTVTKRVRESKLLRKANRELQRSNPALAAMLAADVAEVAGR